MSRRLLCSGFPDLGHLDQGMKVSNNNIMVVGERGLGLEKRGLGLGLKSYGPQSSSSALKMTFTLTVLSSSL